MNIFQNLHNILLLVHIACGAVALLSGIAAVFFKQVASNHSRHTQTGRWFFYGMIGIVSTALPMSIIKPNLFLFLVSIFSFYLAHAGWRYAQNKNGTPRTLDYTSAIGMIFVTIIMIGYGVYLLKAEGDKDGITMLVFGVVGLKHAILDLYVQIKGGVTGKPRLAMHLTLMMGASIATITAFIVTNFETNPRYILWIAPGLSMIPLVIWFNWRLFKRNVA